MMKHHIAKDEPLWWALFSAGGICFAMLVPAAILVFGLLMPMGIIPASAFDYESLRGLGLGWPGLIFAGGVIALPAFHALHRIRHSCADLMLGKESVNKVWAYGLASLMSLMAVGVVLVNLF
ncbi:fumarate reductase subunit FrdD [Terasakiispira papahanaumokuakeensis]|nr:fumarate reductase subunit FrdD [Terasakiispira papahanaumokuakeensis]